jgi:hypothetical protein
MVRIPVLQFYHTGQGHRAIGSGPPVGHGDLSGAITQLRVKTLRYNGRVTDAVPLDHAFGLGLS